MKIKWTVHTVNSKSDINGNRYWFATYTRMSDGKSATVMANAQSNAESMCRQLAGDNWNATKSTTQEIGIRDWNHRSKDLPYMNDCSFKEFKKALYKLLS